MPQHPLGSHLGRKTAETCLAGGVDLVPHAADGLDAVPGLPQLLSEAGV